MTRRRKLALLALLAAVTAATGARAARAPGAAHAHAASPATRDSITDREPVPATAFGRMRAYGACLLHMHWLER